MGCAQRRIGPLNLGWYGFLSSLINGCNLIISQFLVTKLHIHFGFQSFPIFYLLWSLAHYIMLSPFFLVDVYLSLILLILLSGLSIVFIIFSAFSGLSKYSILGCIRLISQFVSFELMFTTIILMLIWSWNDLSIASYFLFIEQPYIIIELSLNLIPNKINISIGSFLQSVCFSASIIEFRLNRKAAIGLFIDWFLFSDSILILVFLVIFCTVLYVLYYSFLFLLMIFAYFTFGNFHLVLAMFFICILAESNRVPFDLPEAESELVAGFITEYSSIYFSLILLTEYANIIGMSFWMIILFSIFPLSLLLVLFFVCLIRSTLNKAFSSCIWNNKWAYFGSFLVIFHLYILLNSFVYWFTLLLAFCWLNLISCLLILPSYYSLFYFVQCQ